MRRFNPEKELKKIQSGNRNKIIFGVVALLLIIGISSSYALYQIRYSKRIIYTKVAPFSTGDLDLAIYVDGKIDTLPEKGTAYVDNIDCDNKNNLIIGWNYDKWSIFVVNIEAPNKCKISFSSDIKNINLNNYLKYNAELNNDETKDHNLRYVGKTPNNYIWFNCNDYNDLTEETAATKCERWRIIGLMNNMTIVDETTNMETNNQTLVKIIRAGSIGNISYDGSGSTNNWAYASLKTSLNTTYYNGSNLSSGKGITAETREHNMIENVKWYLGVSNGYASADQFYERERTENYAPWTGRIGLIYPSDYGFAATGYLSGILRDECFSTTMSSYSSFCNSRDWLGQLGKYWVITAYTSPKYPFYISGSLVTCTYEDTSWSQYAIYPALYLKPDNKIIDGDGSSTTPYIVIP